MSDRSAQISTNVSVTTTSAQFLAANQNRSYLLIQNNGTTAIHYRLDSAATTSDIKIAAGGAYEPINQPTNALHLISASGTNSVSIVEGSY